MDLNEDIRPITDLKTKSAALIKSVTTHRRPIVITQNGQAKVVVQDIATYQAQRKAFLLLKMASQSEAQLQRGRGVKQADVFARLEKKLSRNA